MIPKKILFCTDFSKNSRPAWDLAVDYSKAFGADLLILHVIDYKSFPGYIDWPEKLRELLGSIQEAATVRLEKMAKEAGPDIAVKTYCRTGITSKEITTFAEDESVDLITIGTHGRTGLKHLVMGSVARSVLKTAHRPVLVMEGPPEEGEISE
jgi:universal stress protein A